MYSYMYLYMRTRLLMMMSDMFRFILRVCVCVCVCVCLVLFNSNDGLTFIRHAFVYVCENRSTRVWRVHLRKSKLWKTFFSVFICNTTVNFGLIIRPRRNIARGHQKPRVVKLATSGSSQPSILLQIT
jgi:hypothetical protein